MAAHLLLDMIDLRHAPAGSAIVEIGSVREPSEVPSSLYLSQAASAHGLRFATVDFSERSWRLARQYVGEEAVFGAGCDFLRTFEGEIAVLYLDNFDYPSSEAHARNLRERCGDVYQQHGEEITQARSAEVHWQQFLAAAPKMTTPGWVVIDNTHRHGGWMRRLRRPFYGKGERVIPEALRRGFEVQAEGLGGVVLSRCEPARPALARWLGLYVAGGRGRVVHRALGGRAPLIVAEPVAR